MTKQQLIYEGKAKKIFGVRKMMLYIYPNLKMN